VTYPRLFAVIGTKYDAENNDSATFQLPDLRGRVVMGRDTSSIRTDNISRMGATGGQARHTLTNDELPSHYHSQGSLSLGAAGSYRHNIYDPGHTHTGDIRENGGTSENGYYFNATNGAHKWYDSRIRIHTSFTGVTVNPVEDHTHAMTGKTGSVGSSNSFSLLNPYQTLDYIIYAA
jgi:microcystin-dependent protein